MNKHLKNRTEWIAVDWGTSNLRAWGITENGEIAFTCNSDQGMGKLTSQDYPGILTALLEKHIATAKNPLDVVICGMAGARQGWCEAPYLSTPANLHQLGTKAIQPPCPDPQLNPYILSGVCQSGAGVENVMRGEETQVLGILATQPDFSGTICLPGTHSKWIRVEAGKIAHFSTAMTGELFEILRSHSVLKHTTAGDLIGDHAEEGIAAGLAKGIAEPHLLSANIFQARAAALLSDRPNDWCSGFLSGLLVGAEVAGHRDYYDNGPIPLIGSPRLCHLYAMALKLVGAKPHTLDATDTTLAGLAAARKQIANA